MLPKPINPQTLQGMKQDAQSYEAVKQTVDAHNSLVTALGPGAPLTAAMFSPSTAALSVGSTSGTIKRGKFTVSVGQQSVPNSSVTLKFPAGTFDSAPFAQVIRNGGTGQSPFTYTETVSGITITIATPTSGESYGFQFQLATS